MQSYIDNGIGVTLDNTTITIYQGKGKTPVVIKMGNFELTLDSIKTNPQLSQDLNTQIQAYIDNELEGFTREDLLNGINLFRSFFYLASILPFPPSYLHAMDDVTDYLTSTAMQYYDLQVTGYYYLGIEWLKRYAFNLTQFLNAWSGLFETGSIEQHNMLRITIATSAKVTEYKLLEFQSNNRDVVD